MSNTVKELLRAYDAVKRMGGFACALPGTRYELLLVRVTNGRAYDARNPLAAELPGARVEACMSGDCIADLLRMARAWSEAAGQHAATTTGE